MSLENFKSAEISTTEYQNVQGGTMPAYVPTTFYGQPNDSPSGGYGAPGDV